MTEQNAESSAVFAAKDRVALRREMLSVRMELPEAAHREASARVLALLAGFLSAHPAGVVGFCWPIRREVDCRPVVGDLIKQGWRAVMPTVIAPATPMQCRVWSPGLPMSTDAYGIPIPAGEETCLPDVLLLPLVAFDDAGYRLGYGGGYFDRTLAVLRPSPLTIGIGFECTRVTTIHPDVHDIPLDCVITEAGVRDFRSLPGHGDKKLTTP